MSDPLPEPPPMPRAPWRAYFHRAAGPVFVVGASQRLRYANPAWERATGADLGKVRGMRVSARRSASPLGQALAPPPEVWGGTPATVRRAVPPADAGPPWWDITFVPLSGEGGKPFGVLGFVTVVGEKAQRAEARTVPASLAALRKDHASRYTFDLFAGSSVTSERLVAQARLAAQTTAPVWLVGEAGTGKGTLARVIHHNGPTREKAFLSVECRGLQPYLIEGQLFGKGGLADTGHLGTVYLRDPSGLPRDLQERIVRLAPRVRLISGSTSVAEDEVKSGRLVPAFHTALSVLEIRLSPVRERPEDLPKLLDRLLERIEGPKPTLPDAVGPILQAYDWPGNARELAEIVEQAVRRAGGSSVAPDHLPRAVREKYLIASDPQPQPVKAWTLDAALEAVEKRLIELALRQAGNSQTDAAARLGVFRGRLFRRMEALGIPAPPQPPKPRQKADPAGPKG